MIAFLEAALEEKTWLNTELLEAYSNYYDKDKVWLRSKHSGKTIQDLINEACDDLEESGYDLSNTSTDVVLETINKTVKVEFHMPAGFKELQESRVYLKELLLELQQSAYLNAEFESNILDTIDKVEKRMKDISS